MTEMRSGAGDGKTERQSEQLWKWRFERQMVCVSEERERERERGREFVFCLEGMDLMNWKMKLDNQKETKNRKQNTTKEKMREYTHPSILRWPK